MDTARSAHYDAIIVGARIAGAATALLLARRGHRVLMVDRDRRGRDTLSTHALMRAGVVQLQRWGLLDRVVATGATPVHRVTFHYGDEPVAVEIAEPLYAPRRIVLDEILVSAAEEAGAEVRFGVDVRDVTRDAHGRVTGVRGRDQLGATFAASATTTIGADGRNSLIARVVGAPITRASVVHSAVLYGYWEGVEATGYEWCFDFASGAETSRPAKHVQEPRQSLGPETRAGASGPETRASRETATRATTGGLIPTNDGQVCVWAGVSPERFDALRGDREAALHTILAETTADVARRAAAGTRRGPIRGFVGLPGILRSPWGPGWALVGDAGYYKDAITSHGISDALRDAELLARALDPVLTGEASEAGTLSDYERVRDDLSIPLFDATARIASYDRDLTQLKRLHRALSTEMQRETRFLRSLDAVPLAGAGASR